MANITLMLLFRRLLAKSNTALSNLFFLTVFTLIAIFVAPASFAGESRYAVQAQQMLGGELWSKVLQIENTAPSRAYPETVYAVVFAFDGALWLYTDMGTQRLSRSRSRLERDKENLLPLLRGIDQGFQSYAVVPPNEQEGNRLPEFPKLRNGCLIESIWAYQKRIKEETVIHSAEILCYSSFSTIEQVEINARGEPDGHCVLVYKTDSGHFYVDPSDLSVVGTFRDDIVWHPTAVAEEIELAYGDAVIERAFFVPVER